MNLLLHFFRLLHSDSQRDRAARKVLSDLISMAKFGWTPGSRGGLKTRNFPVTPPCLSVNSWTHCCASYFIMAAKDPFSRKSKKQFYNNCQYASILLSWTLSQGISVRDLVNQPEVLDLLSSLTDAEIDDPSLNKGLMAILEQTRITQVITSIFIPRLSILIYKHPFPVGRIHPNWAVVFSLSKGQSRVQNLWCAHPQIPQLKGICGPTQPPTQA